MKSFGKTLFAPGLAAAMFGAIVATPAVAAGYFPQSELAAVQSKSSPAQASGECSFFLGCPDSLHRAAHAPLAAPAAAKAR
jgi:hypothetical protein